MTAVTLTINNQPVAATVEPRVHLADFLRETQDLTGTHLGCEHGVCGACTVLIDGVPARACITFAVACDGASITTIEGLDDDDIAKELRAAFSREHALQCGYCTPGMLVSARDHVLRAALPDEREIRVAMSGNLCRCTGYVGIVRAIEGVIASRRTRGIAAIPGAGRTELGPAGSGRATSASAAPAAAKARVHDPAMLIDAAAPADFVPQATLDQVFTVAHPRDVVWDFFSRPRDVAGCLPGASIVGEPTDRKLAGKIRVKVGPIVAEFHGTAEIDRDPSTFVGTIRGVGQDARSSSATRGIIHYRLLPGADSGSTQVSVSVGYTLTGPLAQFSRSGLVQEIANGLTRAFAQNLEARIEGSGSAMPQAASELNAGRLMMSALSNRFRMWLRKLLGR